MNPFSPQVAATQGEKQQEQSKSLGAGPTGALVPQIGVSGTSSPIEVSDVEEAPEPLLRREDQRECRHNQARGRGRGRGGRGRGRGVKNDENEDELPPPGEKPPTFGPKQTAEPKPKAERKKRKTPATPVKDQVAEVETKPKAKARSRKQQANKELFPEVSESAEPTPNGAAESGKQKQVPKAAKAKASKGRGKNAKNEEVEAVTDEMKAHLKPLLSSKVLCVFMVGGFVLKVLRFDVWMLHVTLPKVFTFTSLKKTQVDSPQWRLSFGSLLDPHNLWCPPEVWQ